MRGTKGWAVEGRLSMVTRQYASGAGGCQGPMHGHRVRRPPGNPEWPVDHGMWMGHGRSLVEPKMRVRCI